MSRITESKITAEKLKEVEKASTLEKAKEIAIDLISGSNTDQKKKSRLIQNLKTSRTKDYLLKILWNTLLSGEKMGSLSPRARSMREDSRQLVRFGNYLSEAKVSKRNLNKVVDIFKRILERELGTKFYRFGGPGGFTEIKSGIGILLFAETGKAVRVNYDGREIHSLTIWKNYVLEQKGDYTVDLDGLGLMAVGKKLIDIIRNPSPGKIPAYDIVESTGFMTEAKRISPSDFVELIQDNLPSSIPINAVPWSTLTDIALANDYQVPTVVRGTKIGRGKNKRFDLQSLLTDPDVEPDKPAKESEPIYYIKVTPQDPETKKFMSVKGDKKAQSMLRQIEAGLKAEPSKEELSDPDTLFGLMKNLVQVVARGARNSLVIYGGAGIGKTFVVNQTIREEGLTKKDYVIIKGKITTTALYQNLFMHRDGKLLIFDDSDSVWGDQDAANILKAALDSDDERMISWYSPKTLNVSRMSEEEREEYNEKIDRIIDEEPESRYKLPSEFEFNSRIIFISNMPYEKFDKAVLNRSAKIDMTLTQEQLFQRMESIIVHMGDPSVPHDVKLEIMGFLKDAFYKGQLKEASMRTYVAAEDLYSSGVPNWRDLLRFT